MKKNREMWGVLQTKRKEDGSCHRQFDEETYNQEKPSVQQNRGKVANRTLVAKGPAQLQNE